MTEIMLNGQMLWKSEGNDRVLHLRHNDQDPWQSYELFPEYFLPDPDGFSPGIATFMALLKKGWTTVQS